MIEAETKAAYYPPPTMTVYPSTPPASSRFSGAVPAVGGATGTTDGTDPSFHIVSVPPPKQLDWVYNPSDGSVLVDHKGRPMSVDRILATKPLRAELSTRPGPGGKKLTYISGEGVSRTLNDIFGFDGWNLDITKVAREECLKDDRGRFTVVYTAMVRLTHKKSGAYKEDCGAGDSTDKSFGTAVAHALKASITDAMKRAARHFGDKLGNCTCAILFLFVFCSAAQILALLALLLHTLCPLQLSIKEASPSTRHRQRSRTLWISSK